MTAGLGMVECPTCGGPGCIPEDEADRVDQLYDDGHADGFAEGRRESDITGHLLRFRAEHLLYLLGTSEVCVECAEIRTVLGDLLP